MRERIHFWGILTVLAVIGFTIFFGGGLKAQELQNQTVVVTDDMTITLAGNFADGRKHDLAGVGVTAAIDIEGGTLALSGDIEKGTYFKDGKVTLVGTLGLTEDCEYRKGDVALTLGSENGRATVVVRKNALKSITFSAVVTMEVKIAFSDKSLKLQGEVTGGKYTPNHGISFASMITVAEDFTYTQGKVTATLKDGTLDVTVEKSEFKWASVDVVVDVDVTIKDNADLKLEGSMVGKYDQTGFDLDGKLELRETFEYQHPKVVVRMNSGSVGLEIRKSEFKKATFDVLADVAVNVPGSEDLVLGGEVRGQYDGFGMDLEGDLALKEEFRVSGGPVALVLSSGDVALELKRDVFSPLTLSNLTYRARIEVDGNDMKGQYDDGVFRLESGELEDLRVNELIVEPDGDNDDTDDLNDNG